VSSFQGNNTGIGHPLQSDLNAIEKPCATRNSIAGISRSKRQIKDVSLSRIVPSCRAPEGSFKILVLVMLLQIAYVDL
jgi:hypothetical protein